MTSKNLARLLRRKSTPAEHLLWGCLRNRQLLGLKFRRQQPIDDFIVDFCCFEKKLIIELDGSQHLFHAKDDLERTKKLESLGFHITRFYNNEIVFDLNGVIEKIIDNLTN